MWCMASVTVLFWSVLSLWDLEKTFHLHIQNKFGCEKKASGYVRKGFICFSPALGMQGTVRNNRAVPVETLKTVPGCIVCMCVCVFPCSLYLTTNNNSVNFIEGWMYNNILCLQEVSRFKSELQVLYHISFEQSQAELMGTLKSPPH